MKLEPFSKFYGQERKNDAVIERLQEIVDACLTEKVNISRSDFLKAMSDLYDSGDEEVIDRTYSIMANMQVEQSIDELFDEKVPSASKEYAEVLANKIKNLKITPEEKIELVDGIRTGKAYQWSKLYGTKGKVVKLASIVNKKYKGAMELLPWFTAWKGRTKSGGHGGAASSEMFMILTGKNGAAPDKSDVLIDGVKIEVKSNQGGFGFEFTTKQYGGAAFRDEWTQAAENLYKSKGKAFHKKYWVDYEKDPKIQKMPLGISRNKGVTKNHAHLTGPMNAFCFNLQQNGKMSATQVNKWINDSVRKVFKSRGVPMIKVWNGKRFDRYAFMRLWSSCAFDAYKKAEGFDHLMTINRANLSVLTFASGKEFSQLGDALLPAGMDMNQMPGQNNSMSSGSIKL